MTSPQTSVLIKFSRRVTSALFVHSFDNLRGAYDHGGVIEQRARDGYRGSVAIVDKAGNLAGSRGDATHPHSMEFARLRAYIAHTRGQKSLEFNKLTDKPENAYLKQIPNEVAVGGGVPIKVGAEVIGAVGVSCAPGGEKVEACANAVIGTTTSSTTCCASRSIIRSRRWAAASMTSSDPPSPTSIDATSPARTSASPRPFRRRPRLCICHEGHGPVVRVAEHAPNWKGG
jgi:uncharacterized protein GlcG (DUF336 family)